MSTDNLESDAELKALRNELLNGLDKKLFNKQTIQESNCKEVNEEEDEDHELEMLRLQALDAKRNRSKILSNSVPGRFRYDKDSEVEEETDEEDECEIEESAQKLEYTERLKNLLEKDDGDYLSEQMRGVSEHDQNNNMRVENIGEIEFKESDCNDIHQDTSKNQHDMLQENKAYINNNYYSRGNYLTYRDECTKIMSNDAYDPKTIIYQSPANNTLPQDFDLRNFLREKAMKQQELNDTDDFNNALVYSEPITRPIEISNEFKYRPNSNFTRYNHYENNKRRVFSNSERNNGTTTYKEQESEDSDDESYLNSKKLKSVVVAKAEPSNLGTEIARQSNHRYSPYKRK